jgi:hypothetical protein
VTVSQYLALTTNAAAGSPHDPRALATFAAHRVLSAAFPSLQAKYDQAVRHQFKAAIEAGTLNTDTNGAQAAASAAVDAVLGARVTDRVSAFAYKTVPAANATGLDPGVYRRTPAAPGQPAQMTWFAPQLGASLTFSYPTQDGHDLYHALEGQLGGYAPLVVGTPAYASNVEYARIVGGHANLTSTNRTADQSGTMMFWMQGEGTSGPAGQWLTSAARRIGQDATELQRAELYAR